MCNFVAAVSSVVRVASCSVYLITNRKAVPFHEPIEINTQVYTFRKSIKRWNQSSQPFSTGTVGRFELNVKFDAFALLLVCCHFCLCHNVWDIDCTWVVCLIRHAMKAPSNSFHYIVRWPIMWPASDLLSRRACCVSCRCDLNSQPPYPRRIINTDR